MPEHQKQEFFEKLEKIFQNADSSKIFLKETIKKIIEKYSKEEKVLQIEISEEDSDKFYMSVTDYLPAVQYFIKRIGLVESAQISIVGKKIIVKID